MKVEYHVSVNGADQNEGSAAAPFATISRAAAIAKPGDTVIVHAGEYREWVKPENGGSSEFERITYRAAEGEKVVIKGSERITCWENIEGTVWKAELPDSMFGDYNPYKETLGGDWFVAPEGDILHPGEVYLNGKSFYEAETLEQVKNPVMRTEVVNPPWTNHAEPLLHPEDSVYQWCCETKE